MAPFVGFDLPIKKSDSVMKAKNFSHHSTDFVVSEVCHLALICRLRLSVRRDTWGSSSPQILFQRVLICS